MEGHAKNCAERYCELANKKTEQLHTVSPLCLDDHNFKEEELETVGELSVVCSQMVLKCLYLARIGRPDILWSVNKLALAVTRWARACDRRLARLISDIHQTHDYRQYCHVGNTAQHCRLGLFQDSDFCWWPWRLRINLRVNLMYVRKLNMCSHKLDVQEANLSISQFCRIRDYFAGCWFANGRYPCSWFVGCGDRSVTFIK